MVTDWKQIYMNMNTKDKFSCTQTSMERMNTFCCLCWNKVSFCGIIAIFTAFLKWLTKKKWKCVCIIYICQVNIEEWYQQMKQQFLFEEKKNMYSWNILYQATVLSRNGILIVRSVYLKWVKYLEVFKALIWRSKDSSSFSLMLKL